MWAHQPHIDVPDKMADTARAGIFVGMSELYKGYICYYPDTGEFEPVINAEFDPGVFPMLAYAASEKPVLPPPLPPSLPLPPLYVPVPLGKPEIAPVPLPQTQCPPPTPERSTEMAPPIRDAAPRDARRDLFSSGVPTHEPVPSLTLSPLHVPARVPLPPALPVNPLEMQTSRRAGSRVNAEFRHAAGTPVPGSLAVVMAWLAATWTAPYVAAHVAGSESAAGAPVTVVIFSGVASQLPPALRARGARVIEVDILIGGRLHDLVDVTPGAIGWHLRHAAQRGEIQSMHSAVPCETFSVAVDDADMVRSSDFPWGKPRLTAAQASRVFASNALVYFTLDLGMDVFRNGGQVTVENPSCRSDPALPHVMWPAKAHHASLFRTKPVMEFKAATGSVEITTPLCACGLDMQKYVTVLATPSAARVLAPLDGIVCTHGKHAERAYGVTSGGQRGGLVSARYPYLFCVVLACSHLGLLAPGIDLSGVSPLVVPAALGLSVSSRDQVPSSTARTTVPVRVQGVTHSVGTVPPLVFGSRGIPVVEVFSAPVRWLVGNGRIVSGYNVSAVDRVVAPNYTPPAGPGWWNDDDGDLSDDGDDTFTMEAAGVACYYQACVKVHHDACRAAVRTRYSQGTDGMVRHDVPRGYNEASNHQDCDLIWEAMLREMNSHEDCNTWTLRPATECYATGKSPIDSMWVYDCKVDATTSKFLMWKARLVARGDQMVYLRDYLDTYSGVVRHSTFRMFLAMCASDGLAVTGADVSTAYLHAPLRDYVVWMRMPRGFPSTINGVPGLCRLNMAIYGLKQSAREWAITVIAWLTEWGFKQCTSDRYMFVYDGQPGRLLLVIWVDDIFMGHSSDALRSSFMAAFTARFRVKDLGPLSQALGASVSQSLSEGWVSFSLVKYISDLARRFDLFENVSWADIPVPVQLAKECRDAEPTDAEVRHNIAEFAVLAGSVTFVATFARPDVAYAAHLLSTYSARPGAIHLKLARRVLGYLSRTRDMAITYRAGSADASMSFSPLDDGKPDRTGQPHLMVDTDHGVERSVTGWMFVFAGAAVTWAVRGQMLPALSSAESELYGLSTSVCDLLMCAQTLEEMGLVVGTVTLCTDSRGARLLAMDCAAAARTRHIHRRWYFVRYHIDEKRMYVRLVKGSLNRSNFLTKAVGGAPFAADRAYSMGVRE
jgi:hypothetical protein